MTIRSTNGFAAALLGCVSSVALAQPSTVPAPESAGNEIVVTAQKREQKVGDVPVTVTAVTGARMADLGVNSLSELARCVPSLRIQQQSANNPGFVIRGITSGSGSAQQGACVTLYYNGIDSSRSGGGYHDLYDVSRVEVVKGPEATLFGPAAAIGAGSIISAPAQAGTSAGVTAPLMATTIARRRLPNRRVRAQPDEQALPARRRQHGRRLRRPDLHGGQAAFFMAWRSGPISDGAPEWLSANAWSVERSSARPLRARTRARGCCL